MLQLRSPSPGRARATPHGARAIVQNLAHGLRSSLRPPRRTGAAASSIDVPTAIWIAAWAYLALAVLASLVLHLGGDRSSLGTILLFSGRWLILLPAIPLLLAALWRAPAALVPIAAAVLLGLFSYMGLTTGWKRVLPHRSGAPLRVVTFNVDGGDQLAAIWPEPLETWHADVVALQECGDALASAIARGSGAGWYRRRTRELCILSRFPIRAAAVMDRSALERVHEDAAAGIGGTGDVVRYDIVTGAGPIHFTNLHLETPRKGLEGLVTGHFDMRRLDDNTRLRDIESHLARRWVDLGRDPGIVAGDFNTPTESRIFQAHWGDLTDAFSYAGAGFGMTKYNGWIRARIDHVLTGDGITPLRAVVGADLGSDHRPLIVDLTLSQH